MAQLPVTLIAAEGHFCCLNLCNTHNSGNIVCFDYNVYANIGRHMWLVI